MYSNEYFVSNYYGLNFPIFINSTAFENKFCPKMRQNKIYPSDVFSC